MQAKFEAAGYKLPQIVFWNLRPGDASGQKSTPVTLHESGAALVSGFRWDPLFPGKARLVPSTCMHDLRCACTSLQDIAQR